MLKEINLNLYKTFMAVYETKSISKAGKKMFISQPAVSLNLKTLEDQLGVKLFVKYQQSYVPTNAGEILYQSLKKSLNYLNDAEDQIYSSDQYSGKIRLGVQSHIFSSFIAKSLAKFCKKYPNIEFEIWSRSTNEMIKNLDTNYLDVVFDTYPINRPSEDIVIDYVTSGETCFCCKYDSKFPNYIKINDIKNYPVVSHLSYSKHIEELKNAVGQVDLNAKITCGTTEAIVDIVKQGVGIGFVLYDYIAQDVKNKKLRIVETDKELPKTKVYICYNKNAESKIRDLFLKFFSANQL